MCVTFCHLMPYHFISRISSHIIPFPCMSVISTYAIFIPNRTKSKPCISSPPRSWFKAWVSGGGAGQTAGHGKGAPENKIWGTCGGQIAKIVCLDLVCPNPGCCVKDVQQWQKNVPHLLHLPLQFGFLRVKDANCQRPIQSSALPTR